MGPRIGRRAEALDQRDYAGVGSANSRLAAPLSLTEQFLCLFFRQRFDLAK